MYRLLRRLLPFVILSLPVFVFGQQAAPRARIVDLVDNTRLVSLRGNTHPLARAKFDQGVAPDSQPADRMMLLLSRSPEQQTVLEKFLADQQTPGSESYHHWLTPAEFGQKFGPADADVQTITAWLQQQGFQINRVTSGKGVIEFSGNAGQVRQAFHTQVHKYAVQGKEYWANASDPKIPVALAPVVKGVVSLNNFPRKRFSHQLGGFSWKNSGEIVSQTTFSDGTNNYYALGPADFATIYNTAPLLQSGNNGTGQKIAIVGRTNVNLQDVTDFRNLFNLGTGKTSVVIDGTDPGIVPDDEGESLLDLEWANAVAPGASVVLVSAADTTTTSGLDLAATYIIDNNLAGVMSESYGLCEAYLGTAGNQFFQAMWQQAAAQGITVSVSSGDDGSAGCDYQGTDYIATSGLAVNGIASTPYNVAVGGTDFDDALSQYLYWNGSNNSTTLASAKSYIPEMTWNETCAASATPNTLNVCPTFVGTPPDSVNLWAGSGGASNCTTSTSSGGSILCQGGAQKPAWQSGAGIPSDGARDLPDVSFFSAGGGTNSRSFYIMCEADQTPAGYTSCKRTSDGVYFLGAGGTSAAAPSFAGIVALAQQKAGTRFGNINYLLYSLAANPGASCTSSGSQASSCIFHDVVKGNISVPCVPNSPNCSRNSGTGTGVIVANDDTPAYSAAAGYDLATGLGSVNASNLAAAIAAQQGKYTSTSTSLTLNGGTSAITAQHGDAVDVAVTVSPSSSTGKVSLVETGVVDSNDLSGGTAVWSSKLLPGGNYTLTAHYAGDGTHGASDSNGVPVSISPEASKTFVNLESWDANGVLQSYTANPVPYGSNYALRMDVTDAAGTISPAQGVSSKCSSGSASCPGGTLKVTANGTALNGGNFTLNSAGYAEYRGIQFTPGTYNLVANYPGDASYNASTASTTVAITKAATASNLSITSNPPYAYGNNIAIQVNITAAGSGATPTGTVTLTDNGTLINVPLGYQSSTSGVGLRVTGWLTFTTLGTHTLSAQYSGDANYASSNTADTVITVTQATPRFQTLGTAPNPTTPNLPVTISATLYGTASAPTGTITFLDNGTQISDPVNSSTVGYMLSASMTHTFSQLGTHQITAAYSGDTNYTSVTQQMSSLNVVDKLGCNLWLTGSMSPALQNYPATLTATIGSTIFNNVAPTGIVKFYDNGVEVGEPVTYNTRSNTFIASVAHIFETVGSHSLSASYLGDANYASCSGPMPINVVDKFSTNISTLTSNTYRTVVTQQSTLSANITSSSGFGGPQMSGTVTFSESGTQLPGTVTYSYGSGNMTASLNYTFSSAGTHNITVQYNGDGHYTASAATAFPLTVLGPVSLRLSSSQVTLGLYGGGYSQYISVDNNLATSANISLVCTPDSAAASCSLSPSQVNVLGFNSSQIYLTISVPATKAALHHDRSPWSSTGGLILGGVLMGSLFAARRRRGVMLGIIGIILLLSMFSCGGSGGTTTGSSSAGGKTYKFNITATSGASTDTQVLTVYLAQ